MLADFPSSVPPSSPAESEDEAQYLLEPRPARRTRRKHLASQIDSLSPPPPARRTRHERLASQVDSLSPPPPARQTRRERLALQVDSLSPPPPAWRTRRKRLASQVDSLSPPPPARRTRRERLASQVDSLSPPPPARRTRRERLASQVDSLSPPPPDHRRQRRNKPVSRVPTPLIPEPLLPAPALPPRIIVRNDTNGAWWGCRHTCGSGEDCKHEQGWKSGSIRGHEQSHTKHPQCSGSACPAHSILKRRDRPDRRGELGREYNQKRRGRFRAEPSSLPLPSLLSNSLTPSITGFIPVLSAPGATASTSASVTSTTTAPIYPSPLPSQERHTILYVTEPSFEYPSYTAAQGEAAYHYTLLDRELFKNETMVHALRKMLFKGRGVEAVTKHRPEESKIACYLYDYVSHM